MPACELRGETLRFDRGVVVAVARAESLRTAIAMAHRDSTVAAHGWAFFGEGDAPVGSAKYEDGEGSSGALAWNEAGVVAMHHELGFGPIEALGLDEDAVTQGPEDVRGAVPDLPASLEEAFVRAANLLPDGPRHGEKLASAGLWFTAESVGGSVLAPDPPPDPRPRFRSTAPGKRRPARSGRARGVGLAVLIWGKLEIAQAAAIQTAAQTDALLPPDMALRKARAEEAMESILRRRSAGPTDLTEAEILAISDAGTQRSDPEMTETRKALAAMGIRWP